MMNLEQKEQRIGLLEMEHFVFLWVSIVEALDRIPHFWEYYTKEWFYEMCAKGNIQVWAVGDEKTVDAIIVTEVVQFPAMKVLRLLGASGENLDTYSDRLQDVFDGFAKMQGCTRIELVGRPGWVRKFRALRGESYDYVVMSRPVGEQRSH